VAVGEPEVVGLPLAAARHCSGVGNRRTNRAELDMTTCINFSRLWCSSSLALACLNTNTIFKPASFLSMQSLVHSFGQGGGGALPASIATRYAIPNNFAHDLSRCNNTPHPSPPPSQPYPPTDPPTRIKGYNMKLCVLCILPPPSMRP